MRRAAKHCCDAGGQLSQNVSGTEHCAVSKFKSSQGRKKNDSLQLQDAKGGLATAQTRGTVARHLVTLIRAFYLDSLSGSFIWILYLDPGTVLKNSTTLRSTLPSMLGPSASRLIARLAKSNSEVSAS